MVRNCFETIGWWPIFYLKKIMLRISIYNHCVIRTNEYKFLDNICVVWLWMYLCNVYDKQKYTHLWPCYIAWFLPCDKSLDVYRLPSYYISFDKRRFICTTYSICHTSTNHIILGTHFKMRSEILRGSTFDRGITGNTKQYQ